MQQQAGKTQLRDSTETALEMDLKTLPSPLTEAGRPGGRQNRNSSLAQRGPDMKSARPHTLLSGLQRSRDADGGGQRRANQQLPEI